MSRPNKIRDRLSRHWLLHYRPQRSCGQGYVFTRMCDSVHREDVCLSACWDTRHPSRSRHPSGSRYPPGADTPPPRADTPHPGADTRQTVNERPVRILLECILVLYVMILTKQPIHLIRALHRNRSLQQRKKS